MRLSELVIEDKKITIFGLAKNTGKTETLKTILREFNAANRTVGVTSIGRDGEKQDVINSQIDKPTIYLMPFSLVATTNSLIRKSGLSYKTLEKTAYRTPLGQVVIAKLLEGGEVEISGPSSAEDIKMVSDTMLGMGADNILIDGAINRKAASAPAIADSVIMATGAVLDESIEAAVVETKNRVDILKLPLFDDQGLRKIIGSHQSNLLIDENYSVMPIDRKFFVLEAFYEFKKIMLKASWRYIVMRGALSEQFIENLLSITRGCEIVLIIADSTKLFLGHRNVNWYKNRGIHIKVLQPTKLKAITINPIAPKAYRFDSSYFRKLLQDAIPDVCTFDVMDSNYLM